MHHIPDDSWLQTQIEVLNVTYKFEKRNFQIFVNVRNQKCQIKDQNH